MLAHSSPAPPRTRLYLSVATVTFAAATGLASLLAWHMLAGQRLAALGCGGAVDCGTITATRWAYLGPVPVILPAVALYAAALGGLLALEPLRAARDLRREQGVWAGLATLSLIVLGAGAWFVAVQGFVLGRYCPFCLATHLCAGLGSLLILRLAPENLSAAGERRSWWFPVVAAASVLTLLVGGQVLLPFIKPSAPASDGSAAALPVSVRSLALPARDLVLVNGRVHLDPSIYPVLAGSPAPTHLAAVLFDYTCEACRANHALLTAAVSRPSSGQALVLVPTPLDPTCNPAVERLRPEHINACLYARYALAVWKAAPEKFAAYDAWLMSGGGAQPPPIEEARRWAEALVGAEVFGRMLARPELEQALQQAGRLYQTLEAGEIPKLLLPKRLLAGGFSSAKALDDALQPSLLSHPASR